MNNDIQVARYKVEIDYYPDEGGEPTADAIFLAIQDALGPATSGGRLAGVGVECITVTVVA